MNPGLAEYRASEFQELTAALKLALKTIKEDRSQAATKANVARLAGCSMRLLYTDNRRWVVRRIERIQRARGLFKQRQEEKPASGVVGVAAAVVQSNLFRENAELFHEKLALESEIQRLKEELEQKEKDCEAYMSRNTILLVELNSLKRREKARKAD